VTHEVDHCKDDGWRTGGNGVGRLFKMGKMPVNMQLSAYWNVEKPGYVGADWQLRFRYSFCFRNDVESGGCCKLYME